MTDSEIQLAIANAVKNGLRSHNHKGIDSPRINFTDLNAAPTTFSENVQVLAVGGGGSGGSNEGGGGAGGEVKYEAAHEVIAHIGVDQAYPIVVGAGGSFSTFHTITADQGGDGAANGGAGGTNGDATGGGGAGNLAGAGTNGTDGVTNSITGASVYYGGGGGGGGSTTNGTGGQGGGGTGNGTGGTANLGGGGGGGNAANPGGAGGTGVVIIRYVTANFGPCTGGTITTSGGDTIHTFTTSGTFTVVAR